MTFNESFEREAKIVLEDLAVILERREWESGTKGYEELRLALREFRLAIAELAKSMSQNGA